MCATQANAQPRLNDFRSPASLLVMYRLLWIAATLALAQDVPVRFDVATVRPSNAAPGAGMNNLRDPVQATWTNMALKWIVMQAYRVQPDAIVGGPAWITSDKWDIVAKSEKPATRAQQSEMLKPLLAERFKLQVHKETRQLPEYELVVAKGGPKLHEATEAELAAKPAGTTVRRGFIDAHGMPLSNLAFFLRSELGRPVIDRTGLTANYDIKLEWLPDESQPNSRGVVPPADSSGPS
ncbi:MAG TPA: TIGR03435 family protein, partial [Bryobacteraceae bacterium]|nr:TIGR03435 family protein [Bryobacteraceae bacterium]